MVINTEDDTKITFAGHNWEDFNRWIALSKFQFLQDSEYDDNGPKKRAYAGQRFKWPALDWVASTHTTSASLL
ncbi:hypothetical protein DL770_010066 [Monosporascus sp. CRB-9-2]|nr:hypothetical protein DL770_010066 [Monosporascus sp. CRB-9-2]